MAQRVRTLSSHMSAAAAVCISAVHLCSQYCNAEPVRVQSFALMCNSCSFCCLLHCCLHSTQRQSLSEERSDNLSITKTLLYKHRKVTRLKCCEKERASYSRTANTGTFCSSSSSATYVACCALAQATEQRPSKLADVFAAAAAAC
jgi:hypothetical protein